MAGVVAKLGNARGARNQPIVIRNLAATIATARRLFCSPSCLELPWCRFQSAAGACGNSQSLPCLGGTVLLPRRHYCFPCALGLWWRSAHCPEDWLGCFTSPGKQNGSRHQDPRDPYHQADGSSLARRHAARTSAAGRLIVPSRLIRFGLLILLLQVLPRIKTQTDFV
jgi:hypothetical protein